MVLTRELSGTQWEGSAKFSFVALSTCYTERACARVRASEHTGMRNVVWQHFQLAFPLDSSNFSLCFDFKKESLEDFDWFVFWEEC